MIKVVADINQTRPAPMTPAMKAEIAMAIIYGVIYFGDYFLDLLADRVKRRL